MFKNLIKYSNSNLITETITETVQVKKFATLFIICSLLFPTFLSGEELTETRKSKPYPLVPRHKYSGEKEPHCELWSLERVLGKKAECRRRAKRSSEGTVLCRFKRSFINKDDPTLTMCVYEKAGYNLEDVTISSETFVCVKEYQCKR